MAIFFAIILIIIAIEYDDGFMLLMMGFLSIIIVLNIEALFDITPVSYGNAGQMFQLIYTFIAIFCLVKIIMSARQDGLLSFTRGKHGSK